MSETRFVYVVKRNNKYLNTVDFKTYESVLGNATMFKEKEDAVRCAINTGDRVVKIKIVASEVPEFKVGDYVEWNKGSMDGIIVEEIDSDTVLVEYHTGNGGGSIDIYKSELTEPIGPIPNTYKRVVQTLLDNLEESNSFLDKEEETFSMQIENGAEQGNFNWEGQKHTFYLNGAIVIRDKDLDLEERFNHLFNLSTKRLPSLELEFNSEGRMILHVAGYQIPISMDIVGKGWETLENIVYNYIGTEDYYSKVRDVITERVAYHRISNIKKYGGGDA